MSNFSLVSILKSKASRCLLEILITSHLSCSIATYHTEHHPINQKKLDMTIYTHIATLMFPVIIDILINFSFLSIVNEYYCLCTLC